MGHGNRKGYKSVVLFMPPEVPLGFAGQIERIITKDGARRSMFDAVKGRQ